MSFTLQIRKTNDDMLHEVKKFSVYRRITLADDTTIIDKITPKIFLHKPQSQLSLKQRNEDFVLYQICYIDGFGNQICQNLPSELTLHFNPEPIHHLKVNKYKKVEYSLNNNFNKTLTKNYFHNFFSFQKESDTNFNFFLLSENGTKYFEKTLIPFPVNPPANDVNIVQHSIETDKLQTGFYTIDDIMYFHSKESIIETNHYFFNINI